MTCCSAPPPRTLLTIAADPRLLDEIRAGTSVEPSTMTAAEYLRGWFDTDSSLSPKTVERYRATGRTADHPAPWRDPPAEAAPCADTRLAWRPIEVRRPRCAPALGAHLRPCSPGTAPRSGACVASRNRQPQCRCSNPAAKGRRCRGCDPVAPPDRRRARQARWPSSLHGRGARARHRHASRRDMRACMG